MDAVPEIPAAIEAALDDDLNTPPPLAEIAAIAAPARKAGTEGERRRLKSQLLGAGPALGLLQQAPADWFGRRSSGDDDPRIQMLIEQRAEAKNGHAPVRERVGHSVYISAGGLQFNKIKTKKHH